jgi:hypothetical protein
MAAAVAVIGALCGGWLAARAFESPAQREAGARPPTPGPIVVAVAKGTLADEITARADIGPRVSHGLIPQALPERAVVTGRLLAPGSEVQPGIALLAVNGRPLFVLPGKFAFYRELVPGTNGPDVAQLQAGLAAAGLSTPTREIGTYGPATQDGVRALYRAAGSSPFTRPGRMSASARATVRAAKEPARAPQRPIVPLTDVVVVPHLPATLASAPAVGTKLLADKPVATLASGPLVAHAGVAASVLSRIRPGMKARLIADNGRAVRAMVRVVRGRHRSSTEDLRDVTLVPTGRRLPASWNGTNVLARITISLVRRGALIVPTRAIARAADGDTYVLKEGGSGRFVRVAVRTLGSLAGRSAVAPRAPRTLVATDRLRVG